MTVELVQRTLNKALESQNYPEAVMLHSDQGSQYTSHEYEETIRNSGMTHSFSRKGYPYHNASLESWHGHLKREWVYQFKYENFFHIFVLNYLTFIQSFRPITLLFDK